MIFNSNEKFPNCSHEKLEELGYNKRTRKCVAVPVWSLVVAAGVAEAVVVAVIVAVAMAAGVAEVPEVAETVGVAEVVAAILVEATRVRCYYYY